jgi:hypothetical protein
MNISSPKLADVPVDISIAECKYQKFSENMVAIAFLIHVVEVLYIHLFHKCQMHLLKQKHNISTECGVPYLRPAKYLFDLSDRSLNCWHMICSCFSLSI